MKAGFVVRGSHLDNFLSFISNQGLVVYNANRDGDNLYVEILPSKKKLLSSLAKEKGMEIKEVKLSSKEILVKFTKSNLIFILTAMIIIICALSSSFFIFTIKIYGLDCIEEKSILKVLSENGYSTYRPKSQFDVEKICKLLDDEFDLISYASALIVGVCLVININEKIDTSPYIYDYSPLICPVDCVIKEINLTSGTKLKYVGDTAKSGDVIVAPYVLGPTQEKIYVPAKAEVVAEYNVSITFPKKEDYQIIFEKNKSMLYNKLSGLNLISPTQEVISDFSVEGESFETISLLGSFTFNI